MSDTTDDPKDDDVELSPERLKRFTWSEGDVTILEQPEDAE